MLVHLDNSLLVDAFTGERRSMPNLIGATSKGDVLTFATLALYEWLRGPRTEIERSTLTRYFDFRFLPTFSAAEAATAAALYRHVARARQRQADLAIAACALERGAAMWTLNPEDFEDIPQLKLYRP
jgi:predicted nucleic acid-binding protein